MPTSRCARSDPRRSAPAVRSKTSTRCARSGVRSTTRRPARSALVDAGEAIVQGARVPLERERGSHLVDALEGGGERLPLLSRARLGAAGPERRVHRAGTSRTRKPCRLNAASAWARLFNGEPPPLEAIATVVELGLDELVLAAHGLGADLRLALAARVHNEAAARPDAALCASIRGHSPPFVRLEADGSLSAHSSQRRSSAELLEHGGEPAAILASLGFRGARRRRARGSAFRDHRREPRRVGTIPRR